MAERTKASVKERKEREKEGGRSCVIRRGYVRRVEREGDIISYC